MTSARLSVRHLVTSFATKSGTVRAVDDVSFDVPAGATLGLVGESGCGKSVTSLSLLRLVSSPPGRIESGEVWLDGRNLLALSEREMRAVRGARIAMVFQEPMTSLNPVYSVGDQISEAIRLHRPVSRKQARERAVELLAQVGIPSPSTRVDAYPHELSGGMRQRVMIAMALSCDPDVLVADEPTTALDVTIQAQILDLLRKLQEARDMSILLVTHDLGVVAETARDVVVMYAGRVVERGPASELLAAPLHPYTRGLLRSVPPTGASRERGAGRPRRLPTIEGMVPDLAKLAPGCRFASRCELVADACHASEPELREVSAGRFSRCHVAAPFDAGGLPS